MFYIMHIIYINFEMKLIAFKSHYEYYYLDLERRLSLLLLPVLLLRPL